LKALAPPIATAEGPTSVTIDPQVRFAYVCNSIAGSISVFAIDAATGALTPSSSVTAATIPVGLTLDAAGRFAYVANFGSDNVTTFAVNSTTGALTPVSSPVNAGMGPVWVALTK
jgi:6-phosphogluconolactonase